MTRVLNKWYFGLVLLPILINYLTEFISLPDLLSNWNITAMGALMILIGVLSYELYQSKIAQRKPKEYDKRIINELLEILDLENFKHNILDQNGWYGYKQESIRRLINFTYKADSLHYKPSDKQLGILITKLNKSILTFTDYSSGQLYGDNDLYYVPDKKTDLGYKQAEIAQPIMNGQTKEIGKKLNVLLDYVKSHNYID